MHLCGQIEDEKTESSSHMAYEDSPSVPDTARSFHASPASSFSKDRTSIEDFEIIKPISRGAFGRVFLARKRATGDVFAIKVRDLLFISPNVFASSVYDLKVTYFGEAMQVLKKADMIRKNAVQSILAERDILISVRNPFVVRRSYI